MAANGALTRRQRKFCVALLGARTIEEAAELAGIARRTAFNYLAMPHVRQEISRLLDATTTQAMLQAVDGMAGAIATLKDIHADDYHPASARVSAARAILENAVKLRGEIDITRRLDALEEVFQAYERQSTTHGRD